MYIINQQYDFKSLSFFFFFFGKRKHGYRKLLDLSLFYFLYSLEIIIKDV